MSSINYNRKLNSLHNIPFQEIFPDCKEVFNGNKSRAREFVSSERTKLSFHCLQQLISQQNEYRGKQTTDALELLKCRLHVFLQAIGECLLSLKFGLEMGGNKKI
jgi:hypothetical protein